MPHIATHCYPIAHQTTAIILNLVAFIQNVNNKLCRKRFRYTYYCILYIIYQMLCENPLNLHSCSAFCTIKYRVCKYFLCIFHIYLAPPLHIIHFNFESVPIFSYLYLLTISHFFKSSPKILSIFLVKPSLYIITFIS